MYAGADGSPARLEVEKEARRLVAETVARVEQRHFGVGATANMDSNQEVDADVEAERQRVAADAAEQIFADADEHIFFKALAEAELQRQQEVAALLAKSLQLAVEEAEEAAFAQASRQVTQRITVAACASVAERQRVEQEKAAKEEQKRLAAQGVARLELGQLAQKIVSQIAEANVAAQAADNEAAVAEAEADDARGDATKRKDPRIGGRVIGKRMSAKNDRGQSFVQQKDLHNEVSVDHPDPQDTVQRMRMVEYSESSSEGGDEFGYEDSLNRDEIKARRHVQKRSSGLSVVSRTKVLRSLPTRLQVLFSRQLKRLDYPIEAEDEVICRAGDASEEYNRFVVLDDGVVDVVVPQPDGTDVFIGRMGPGSILGGTLVLGLSSTHLFTIRRAYTKAKVKAVVDHHGVEKDKEEPARPIELQTFIIPVAEMVELEEQYKEELDVLRSRSLSDMHQFVVPHLQRLAQAGFFRQYCSAFVKQVVKNMDMRICRPGELIFQENTPAQSMAILFCGWIDILIGGKHVATQGEPGICFGESALLEDGAVRGATVRCNTQADCLICLLQKEDFLVTLNEFPEEKMRLQEQVKMKLTRLSMQSVFVGCDVNFLFFLSAIAESVELEAHETIYGNGAQSEELLMPQRGDAVVIRRGEANKPLPKGSCVGYQAAIGVRRGPPDYTIQAGERGCLLIRITHEILAKAFVFFPNQVAGVIKVGGLTELPLEHPFQEKQGDLWGIMTPLVSQAFHSQKFDENLIRSLASVMRCEICDPGCVITEEGKESNEMVFLLHGSVNWSTAGKVSAVENAPRHFDEAIVIGTQRRQTATIIAKTLCVLWFLSTNVVPEMKIKHFELCKVFEDAATLRRSVQVQLQARLRNMKTFRRFRSEILELISCNLDIRTFLPGDKIFEKNDVGKCMYILLRGRAEIVGHSAHLDEGSTFGEMCMFGQVRRNMTVTASTMCICNVVHRQIITYAFNQFPEDQRINKTDAKGVEIMKNTRVQSTEDRLMAKGKKHQQASGQHANPGPGAGPVAPPRASAGPLTLSRASGSEASKGKRHCNAPPTRASQLRQSVNTQKAGRIFPPEIQSTGDQDWESVSSSSDEENSDSKKSTSKKHSHMNMPVTRNRRLGSLVAPSPSGSRRSSRANSRAASPEAIGYPPAGLGSPRGSARGLLPAADGAEGPGEPGPQQLEKRFQHHSRLFHTAAPKLPPANTDLYRTPREAEEKLSRAFRNLMPPNSAAISASVHGLPSASRSSRSARSANASQELSRESMISITGSVRSHRVWPTYTDPLPPLHQQNRPAPAEQAAAALARPKESECIVAVAAQLQLLASSLLRIHTKPDLKPLDFPSIDKEPQHSPDRTQISGPSRDVWYSTWAGEAGDGRAMLVDQPTRLKSLYLVAKKPVGERRRPRRPQELQAPMNIGAEDVFSESEPSPAAALQPEAGVHTPDELEEDPVEDEAHFHQQHDTVRPLLANLVRKNIERANSELSNSPVRKHRPSVGM